MKLLTLRTKAMKLKGLVNSARCIHTGCTVAFALIQRVSTKKKTKEVMDFWRQTLSELSFEMQSMAILEREQERVMEEAGQDGGWP